MAALLALLPGTVARAQELKLDPRFAATSSTEAKNEARDAIAWQALSPDDQRRVRRVVDHASVYRRLPTRVAECNPEVFGFLVDRPEAVTGIWNLMGISQLTVERESDSIFVARDNQGGEGRIEVLHTRRDANARGDTLVFVNGVYRQKPMPRPIRAYCVLLLRSGSTVETNGRTYVTARVDAFVKFERVAADLVARGLQPLIAQTADHNFTETMKFVSTFSRTAERNPAGMRRLAAKLTGLDARARSQMIEVCVRAHEQAEALTIARTTERARLAQLRESGEQVR